MSPLTLTIDDANEKTLKVWDNLLQSQVTFTGVSTGTAIVRVISKDNDSLETPVDNVIDLATVRTFNIENRLIDSIAVTVAAGTGVMTVRQWDLVQ